MVISLFKKNGFINDDNTCNNICISGVFGLDFNLITVTVKMAG